MIISFVDAVTKGDFSFNILIIYEVTFHSPFKLCVVEINELAAQVRTALDKLVEEKKIEKKIIKETIGEEAYYKTIQSTIHAS